MLLPLQLNQMTRGEIIAQISFLEDGYAEALKDGESTGTLNQIWRNIQLLHLQLVLKDEN